jgi:hypothetical protein
LKDLTQAEIDAAWKNVFDNPIKWAMIEFLFVKREIIIDTKKVRSARAKIVFGFPL